jgi:diguanylate cyclase
MSQAEETRAPQFNLRREQGLRFVRRMYLPRVVGLALGGVAIAGVLIANGAHPGIWAALFVSAILWPHIALLLGTRSRNPFRTELRSLIVDSALGGAWIALMQFNLLPSVVILIMLSMDKMAVGGARFLLRCTVALLLACAAVSAVLGFEVRPYTSMVQIIGSLPLLVLYPLVVGLTTYRLARRLREQNQLLSEESRADGLSGLLNRRHWEEAVAAGFERCVRTARPASLLMLDLDHFKSINDRHGHPAGDEVIRGVAAILRESLREDDVPGRYGGEEFGVLLPDTAAAGAEVIAERVRKRIESASLSKSGLRVTASIGIAELEPEDVEHTAAISRADRALYAAKERGRNRTVLFCRAGTLFALTSVTH